jgi:hypothetical protein
LRLVEHIKNIAWSACQEIVSAHALRTLRSGGARTSWSSAGTGSPANSILIQPNSSSSTRPALPPISLEGMDAAGADGDWGPLSRTATTRRSPSSPVSRLRGAQVIQYIYVISVQLSNRLPSAIRGSMMRPLRRAEAARGGYLRQLHQQRPGLGVLDRPGAGDARTCAPYP